MYSPMMRNQAYRPLPIQRRIFRRMKITKQSAEDYEYKRLGTVSLLAGIDLQTGEAIPLVRDRHSSKEYIEFLQLLDSKYPKEDKSD